MIQRTASTVHIPVLRAGRPYASAETTSVAGARISQANSALIRRDLNRIDGSELQALSSARLYAICAEAAKLFTGATLPLGDGGDTQAPDDYLRLVADSCGLPHALCRNNMGKIAHVLADMPNILRGLTRGLDPAVIDDGIGTQAGVPVSFFRAANVLGVVLPSNSPGVNSLWLPAIALKVPVALKPGREDPWTPYRIVQALIAAGCPASAFGFYPTDHEGAHALLAGSGRALLFGDANTTRRWAGNPAIEIHGPGYSKVVIGADAIGGWRQHLDVLATSVAANGGRSCVNASTIVVPAHGREIAAALAERLAAIAPLPADDTRAQLAGFANPAVAESIDAAIDAGLAEPGAEDLSLAARRSPRRVALGGRSYLLPTVVRCDSFEHPLANREFLFPYCSVVEVPQAEMLSRIGPSLVVTAITADQAWRRELLASPLIERLNLGAMPTSAVRWDQPHEGNLFEFLYRRRAVQSAD